jgi:5-methylcytosine-specific restriction endonuclease McrA
MSDTYNNAPPYAKRYSPEMTLGFSARMWRHLFRLAREPHVPEYMWRWLYDTYMQSLVWRNKREARQVIDNHRCSSCGCGWPVEVHHLHYRTIGDEDVKRDLRCLCKTCHAEADRLRALENQRAVA